LSTDIHTIFSINRTAELQAALTAEGIPVFAAWGRDKKLIALAAKCLAAIPKNRQPQGVQCVNDGRLYAYPSPPLKKHKLKWLEQIQAVVDLKQQIHS